MSQRTKSGHCHYLIVGKLLKNVDTLACLRQLFTIQKLFKATQKSVKLTLFCATPFTFPPTVCSLLYVAPLYYTSMSLYHHWWWLIISYHIFMRSSLSLDWTLDISLARLNIRIILNVGRTVSQVKNIPIKSQPLKFITNNNLPSLA